VLVAARDIEPGAQITEEDLRVVHVASEGLDLLPEEYAEEVVGAYAAGAIPANTLLDERMVSTDTPIAEDRAVVSIPLDPTLTPAEKVRAGDLVQVVRAASASGGKAEELATAYVLSVTEPASDELGSQQLASASLLVPAAVVADVIDAASAGEGGLAILASGLEPDVPLEVAE
jgi:hypothetical protein